MSWVHFSRSPIMTVTILHLRPLFFAVPAAILDILFKFRSGTGWRLPFLSYIRLPICRHKSQVGCLKNYSRNISSVHIIKRWVWPLLSSFHSRSEGLILGSLVSGSGKTPHNLISRGQKAGRLLLLLKANCSIPDLIPESITVASTLKAALQIPA